MSNMGGLVVLLISAMLIIMGIKGSQHALFPDLFGAPTPAPDPSRVFTLPQAEVNASNGKCPSGYILVGKSCVAVPTGGVNA